MMLSARPKTWDQQVQDIAAAVHARGVFLTRVDTVVGSVEAALLCRSIRAAHERTRGDRNRHAQVIKIVGHLAAKLGAKGPVLLPRTTWNTLRAYAGAKEDKAGMQKPAHARSPR